MQKLILISLLTISIFQSCKNQEEILPLDTDSTAYVWQELVLNSDKHIHNIYKTQNRLYFSTMRNWIKYDNSNQYQLTSKNVANYFYGKMPINDDMYTELDYKNILYMFDIDCEFNGCVTWKRIDLDTLDATITGVNHSHNSGTYWTQPIAINNHRQVLIGVLNEDSDTQNVYYLLKYDENHKIIDSQKIIIPKPSVEIRHLYTVYSFYGKFFIGGDMFSVVYPDGTYKTFDNLDLWSLHKMFEHQGVLYALDWQNLFASTDQGETWQKLGELNLLYPNYTYNFATIDDRLVIYHQHQYAISEIEFKDGAWYRLKPIKTKGMNQDDITSIEEFRDTVYVGTSSGLFRKPLETFWDFEE